MRNLLLISAAVLSLSACLATRDQIRGGGGSAGGSGAVKRETQQQVIANQQAQVQSLEEQIRNLNGRIATLENSLGQVGAEKQDVEARMLNERSQMEARLKVYEEALSKMEQQYLSVSQKLEGLQMAKESAPAAAAAATATPKKTASGKPDFFAQAEEDFKKKSFRQAIVNYQKYREANSKGSNYAEATYKMGVCFQELKMKDEATPFFNEVVEKYPKSKAAEKAKLRLKAK